LKKGISALARALLKLIAVWSVPPATGLSGKVVVGRFDFHRLRAGFASNGVFFSIVIAEAAIAGAGILLFLRGGWKLQTI
jgi:hypothetical protein